MKRNEVKPVKIKFYSSKIASTWPEGCAVIIVDPGRGKYWGGAEISTYHRPDWCVVVEHYKKMAYARIDIPRIMP